MSYELSFSETFFFGECDPYETDITATPTSVYAAICCCKELDPDKWQDIAAEVFQVEPDLLTEEAVMRKIRKTDTCSNLNVPVRVWIDEQGWYKLEVY